MQAGDHVEVPCMQTVLNSETSQRSFSTTNQDIKTKAATAPALPDTPSEMGEVKPQISAPSYLNYLRENDQPPFKKPDHEPRPCILIGAIMTEAEAVTMIAAADSDKQNGLRRFLGDFMIEKHIIAKYFLSEKNFLINLLIETIDYAAQRDFDAFKLAALITIYLSTHLYFKWYYWQPPAVVWKYFKDLMIRHTINDTPDGVEIFEPEDSYDIISHFHTVYLTNLPLIHIITFGTPRLKLLWPFKFK